MNPEATFAQAEARAFAEAGVTTRNARVPLPKLGVEVAIREAGPGDAPPVLLLGGNAVAATWAPLMARLPDLRLVAVDRPGLGLSTRPDFHGVDVRDYAARFLDEILDALDLPRASFVANSLGGYWSLCFALAHPARVARLALLGEPAGSARVPSRRHRLLGTPPWNRLLLATVMRPGPRAMDRTFAWLQAHPERIPPSVRDASIEGSRLPGASRSWRTIVERLTSLRGPHRATYALRGELGRVGAPTLFLWGERDPLGSPTLGEEMARLMPRARVERLADAGHLPWLDRPDETASLVRAFLARAPQDEGLVGKSSSRHQPSSSAEKTWRVSGGSDSTTLGSA